MKHQNQMGLKAGPLDYAVSNATGCWLWLGEISRKGYGRKGIGGGKKVMAHRYAYESLVGPIPSGLQLDHLCRNRLCVNPKHLEPVTNQENARRGVPGINQLRKTHCPHGHAYTPENTHMEGGKQKRRCRQCVKNRTIKRRKNTACAAIAALQDYEATNAR